MENLFVYGTLAPDRENAHVLRPLGGEWQTAFVRGFYFAPHQWTYKEVPVAFPGLLLSDKAPLYQGMLFTSERLAAFWEELDRFEDIEYHRVQTTVYMSDQRKIRAYVYEIGDADFKEAFLNHKA